MDCPSMEGYAESFSMSQFRRVGGESHAYCFIDGGKNYEKNPPTICSHKNLMNEVILCDHKCNLK
jgi:hypothetical protein